MKKYLQVSIVIGLLGLLVMFRRLKDENEQPNTVLPQPFLIAATPTPVAISEPSPSPQSTTKPQGRYKDGTYTGSVEDAFYGNIQVQAVIQNGQLVDVVPLQYPNDNRTSISINNQALPLLKQEAIRAQSATIDAISGASSSSPAYMQSLANALHQAQ